MFDKLLKRSLETDVKYQFCTSVVYGLYNPDHWFAYTKF